MTESLLLTISQIREYIDLQPTYDQERFNTYVKRVQRNQLRELLRDELYYDFFNNITDQNYVDLLEGKDYTYNSETIKYYGLRPFLAFHVAALIVSEGDLQLTEMGSEMYTNNYSKHNSRRDVRNDYFAEAQRYGNEVIKFLDENEGDYNKWDYSLPKNPTNGAFFIF